MASLRVGDALEVLFRGQQDGFYRDGRPVIILCTKTMLVAPVLGDKI